MTFATLTRKESTMKALLTRLREAWRFWSERRRQYRIDRAVYRMGGGGKRGWSYAVGDSVEPVGPLTPRVPTEGTTRWSEALYRNDHEADHGNRTGGKRNAWNGSLAWRRWEMRIIDVVGRVLVVAAVLLAAGCAGETPKPEHVEGLAGSIVEVDDDGRYLYFECVGRGSPTVVLEAGFGGGPGDWGDVQPQLGGATRTCSYARAGLHGSAELPGVHDAGDEIDDLEVLLDRADLDPPYVLVGHSYGGLLARLFAHDHRSDVAGVVLVEALHPDFGESALGILPRTPAFARQRRELKQRVVEGVDLRASEALDRRVRSLGATRLIVVTAGKTGSPDLAPPLRRALDREWLSLQTELAALSSESIHIVALRSDHFVQQRFRQPEVVLRAVLEIVRAEHSDTRLAPCAHIFRGLAVRCRS
jgi:pimeloyl-ACP methyl ester carboxylesterase